jgi:LCP family protein required for cell wall assembly
MGASDQKTTKQLNFYNGLLIGCVSLFASLFILILLCLFVLVNKYHTFLSAANLTHQEVAAIFKQVNYHQQNTAVSFLVLGIDTVANRNGDPQLSDTIILLKLDLASFQVNLLSLPRDLWSDDYQTKINALYHYGQEKYPDSPERFPTEVIAELTGVPIDYTLVLNIDQLGELINLIGGIEVNVAHGFTDTEFPRDDVDIKTISDPNILYETISFEAGLQTMDGETALKYIRSRHSDSLTTGTDVARSQRQQQIISAILDDISEPWQYWLQPEKAGLLVNYYQKNFGEKLPLATLLELIRLIGPNINQLSLTPIELTFYPENPSGLIENPKNLRPYQDQWVYLIRNEDLFKEYLLQQFNN